MSQTFRRIDIEDYLRRTRALDLTEIDWEEVARHPLPQGSVRVLRHLQNVEHHTVVFPRTIFSSRAVNDPAVGPFLVTWLYEESFHGRALARFLAAAGHPVPPRSRQQNLYDHVEYLASSLLAWAWKDVLALHMTWGAIHEFTTITGYQRLARVSGHPVLSDLLARIVRDEARHFDFYFHEAAARLERPETARRARRLMELLWTPVGVSVDSTEAHFAAHYLFSDEAGWAAACGVDHTIARLPGFEGARFVESWLERNVDAGPAEAA